MRMRVAHDVETTVTPTPRVLEMAAMFGLGVDGSKSMTIVPHVEIDLPLERGAVALITGPSGGGKSTLLRLVGEMCGEAGRAVLDLDALPAPAEISLVDVFDLPLAEAAALLARVGLSDAFVMLRRPRELSDGQRHRLRLAQLMHEAEALGAPAVVLADEFSATLDRMTAKVIARQARRWTTRTGHALIAATTHDDLLEALEPDVLIWKGFGDEMEVMAR